ncbi:hypothetical protein [Wolbachia endosymbiont of Aedes albopictus]|uniref:hypothetical protein n=1 Tax=Wolbachia endosymbiont of Aedes albopictus TaxID=167957 RepID=UPI002168F497|nr:hypothetical protein [Wolbachia endosymbiont of Aedes albopictus]UVW84300.1 hypothetical protein NHG98_02205 [Wolbachia endosymbiont of Aedes albopictus]
MNRGMTVHGGMTVRGGMKVKQFVIPLRVSGIYVKRYRGGMTRMPPRTCHSSLESSFPYNLIENVVTTFYDSLLVSNLDPRYCLCCQTNYPTKLQLNG